MSILRQGLRLLDVFLRLLLHLLLDLGVLQLDGLQLFLGENVQGEEEVGPQEGQEEEKEEEEGRAKGEAARAGIEGCNVPVQ